MLTQISLPIAYLASGIVGEYLRVNYIFLVACVILAIGLLGTVRSNVAQLK